MYTLCYCYIPYVTSTGPYPTGTSSISQSGHRHIGTNSKSQTLVPAIAVHLLYHKSWSLSHRYFLLDPALQIYPLYHTYWSLSFRYIPNITSTGPCSTSTSLIPQYCTLSYRYIPYISNTGLCHVLPVHPLYHST